MQLSEGKLHLFCCSTVQSFTWAHVCADGTVSVYSRNSENNTAKYPDIVAAIPKLLKAGVKSLVLDCEAVAYDRKEGKLLPFQVGQSRR